MSVLFLLARLPCPNFVPWAKIGHESCLWSFLMILSKLSCIFLNSSQFSFLQDLFNLRGLIFFLLVFRTQSKHDTLFPSYWILMWDIYIRILTLYWFVCVFVYLWCVSVCPSLLTHSFVGIWRSENMTPFLYCPSQDFLKKSQFIQQRGPWLVRLLLVNKFWNLANPASPTQPWG